MLMDDGCPRILYIDILYKLKKVLHLWCVTLEHALRLSSEHVRSPQLGGSGYGWSRSPSPYPLVIFHALLWKMTIKSSLICPLKMVIFHSKVSVGPEGHVKEDAFHPRGPRSILLEPRLMGGTGFSAEDCDPLRQTTYAPSTAFAYPIGKSRAGAPRQQWRHFTHRYIWDNLWDERTEYENTNRQNQTKTSIGSRTDLCESRAHWHLSAYGRQKKVSIQTSLYHSSWWFTQVCGSNPPFHSCQPSLLCWYMFQHVCEVTKLQFFFVFFSLHFSTIKTKTVADVFCLWRIYSTP